MDKKEKKVYGYFNDDGSEYIVTEPNTPLPFVNYYWNDTFISGASQHLAGIGCFTERPMQYMHPDCRALMVRDENRHFYIRDMDSGKFWSPGWYPVLTPLDSYSCRHGLGYSVINSALDKIEVSLRLFVPRKDPCEVWTLTVKNTDKIKRRVQSFAFVDWLLTGYPQYCDYHSNLHCEYDEDNNVLMCWNDSAERVHHEFFNGFIASDVKPAGFDSSKREFIGYGQMNRPQAVIDGKCKNSIGVCEKLVGALEHIFELLPNEEKTVNIIIGAADCLEFAQKTAKSVFVSGNVEKEFEATKESIARSYDKVKFKIPDKRVENLFNHWIKRAVQLHTEVGTDTGKGLRDVLQAAWAVSSYDYSGAKQKIMECLRHQFNDGHTLRGWNPVDDHYYSDGPVWIGPAVDSYLKETRDFDFLNVVVPYFDFGEATVWEHVLQAVRKSTDDIGPRGFIKARWGDWNDSLNMIGGRDGEGDGESVWTTIGMVFCINCTLDIIKNVVKDVELEREFTDRRTRLVNVINEKGWDGDWYLQGINDLGEKVGTHTEKEGRVFLNAQTWSILAGISEGERLEKILKVIDNDLECDYGSLVLTPAYKSPNPNIGRITWFVPGMWENASPYCHGTSFKIVADTYIKRGDEAYNSMMKILPDSDLNPSEHSGVPPYMVTNMYYGPEHPRKGQILYSWVTGTSDWLFKAMNSHIMGVRATYEGLIIDPCVPSHWREFGLKRSYLNAEYEVSFENPDGKQSGVALIEVDGKKIDGVLLPVFDDNKLHQVKVVM